MQFLKLNFGGKDFGVKEQITEGNESSSESLIEIRTGKVKLASENDYSNKNVYDENYYKEGQNQLENVFCESPKLKVVRKKQSMMDVLREAFLQKCNSSSAVSEFESQ